MYLNSGVLEVLPVPHYTEILNPKYALLQIKTIDCKTKLISVTIVQVGVTGGYCAAALSVCSCTDLLSLALTHRGTTAERRKLQRAESVVR